MCGALYDLLVASMDIKMVVWVMGSVGATGAGVFVLGIRQGEPFFFFTLCVSKYSEFCEEIKNG